MKRGLLLGLMLIGLVGVIAFIFSKGDEKSDNQTVYLPLVIKQMDITGSVFVSHEFSAWPFWTTYCKDHKYQDTHKYYECALLPFRERIQNSGQSIIQDTWLFGHELDLGGRRFIKEGTVRAGYDPTSIRLVTMIFSVYRVIGTFTVEEVEILAGVADSKEFAYLTEDAECPIQAQGCPERLYEGLQYFAIVADQSIPSFLKEACSELPEHGICNIRKKKGGMNVY